MSTAMASQTARNTLVIEALPAGHKRASPLMKHLTRKGLLSIPRTKRVTVIVKDANGEVIPVEHKDYPLKYLQSASSHIAQKVRSFGRNVEFVQLPGTDARAYYNLLNAIADSFESGEIKLCATIKNENQPLCGYYRMEQAAAASGMDMYVDSLICRSMAMLFGDLSIKPLSATVEDVKGCLALLDNKDEYYQELAGAIGRAIALGRLARSNDFTKMLAKSPQFKNAVEKARKKWLAKKEGGEDILKSVW